MRRNRKNVVTVMLILLLAMVMTFPVQAAKSTAKTVTAKIYRSSSKEYMTVQGLDSKKKVVWKYVTGRYPATELRKTKCVIRKDKVYVFEGSRITVFRKKDGKRVWTVSGTSPAGYVIQFDKSNNLYVTGFYEDIIYKVSGRGKILWKKNIKKTRNYWPYKIVISGSKAEVRYQMNEKDPFNKKKHKVVLNTKNGRLIKYS